MRGWNREKKREKKEIEYGKIERDRRRERKQEFSEIKRGR